MNWGEHEREILSMNLSGSIMADAEKQSRWLISFLSFEFGRYSV
jgi:hypothetical protein